MDSREKMEMRYALAILVPPLAVFKCKRPTQTALNVALTLCFFVPGALHAAMIVFDHSEEQRAQDVQNAIREWQKRAAA
ncbi:MAG: YqaE/Pmp3 family membrane protein [Phycisphaeraceae bacterium]|nr:YqaE/Pmp3 family membrane protein [Phycisphaeraceae bacterium]